MLLHCCTPQSTIWQVYWPASSKVALSTVSIDVCRSEPSLGRCLYQIFLNRIKCLICHSFCLQYITSNSAFFPPPGGLVRVHQHAVLVPREVYAVTALCSAWQSELITRMNLVLVPLIQPQTLRRNVEMKSQIYTFEEVHLLCVLPAIWGRAFAGRWSESTRGRSRSAVAVEPTCSKTLEFCLRPRSFQKSGKWLPTLACVTNVKWSRLSKANCEKLFLMISISHVSFSYISYFLFRPRASLLFNVPTHVTLRICRSSMEEIFEFFKYFVSYGEVRTLVLKGRSSHGGGRGAGINE